MPDLKDKKLAVFANFLQHTVAIRLNVCVFGCFDTISSHFMAVLVQNIEKLVLFFNFKTRQILNDFGIPRKKIFKWLPEAPCGLISSIVHLKEVCDRSD